MRPLTLPAALLLVWAALEVAATAAQAGGAAQQASRRLLQQNGTAAAGGGGGGAGRWESGGDVPFFTIYANLMKRGDVVAWTNTNEMKDDSGKKGRSWGTLVWRPDRRTAEEIGDDCGIFQCKNPFCAAQTITADNKVLVFGGNEESGIAAFREYDHETGKVWSGTDMASGRWYPSTLTLNDSRVLVVGGVAEASEAGYVADPAKRAKSDNPTFTVFNLATRKFSADKQEMREQLEGAWPIHTYPSLVLMPDGGVAMAAGRTMWKYKRTGPDSFEKEYEYEPRPGAPWSYPQTGLGLLLPLEPPYNKLTFLAAGGVSKDRADPGTPASAEAHTIELTGRAGAEWKSVGPMPHRRVMGDAVILCDGTVGLFGGAAKGKAGWSNDDEGEPVFYEFKDGTTFDCPRRCTLAFDFLYEPAIWDPATGKWSAKGSLAEAERPRLYHSQHLLLDDCTVLAIGGEVTRDTTTEIYSPPYLDKGPRPSITSAPEAMLPGQELTVSYTSEDPVARAILIRNAAATHSMAFDARAAWLTIASNAGGSLKLQTPPTSNLLPPGLYMLVLLSDKGVPSKGHILSVNSPAAAA